MCNKKLLNFFSLAWDGNFSCGWSASHKTGWVSSLCNPPSLDISEMVQKFVRNAGKISVYSRHLKTWSILFVWNAQIRWYRSQKMCVIPEAKIHEALNFFWKSAIIFATHLLQHCIDSNVIWQWKLSMEFYQRSSSLILSITGLVPTPRDFQYVSINAAMQFAQRRQCRNVGHAQGILVTQSCTGSKSINTNKKTNTNTNTMSQCRTWQRNSDRAVALNLSLLYCSTWKSWLLYVHQFFR